MQPITSEFWQHKEDPDNVIRILKDDRGIISVCQDDLEATVFHLTRDELHYNFAPTEHPHDPATAQEEPA